MKIAIGFLALTCLLCLLGVYRWLMIKKHWKQGESGLLSGKKRRNLDDFLDFHG